MKEGLLLIDGNACAARAYYAVSPRRGAKGRFQSVPHDFLHLVLRLRKAEQPRWMGVLWEDPPPGLKAHLPLIRQALEAVGIGLLHRTGISVAQWVCAWVGQAKEKAIPVTLVSTRLSLLRWVQEGVTLVNPARDGLRLSPRQVESLYGVGPSRIPDWLILVGYPADKIPGVPGIGPKRAAQLIQRFGSIEEILASVDPPASSVGRLLRNSQERIRQGLRHLRISPVGLSNLSLRDLELHPPDVPRVYAQFSRWKMTDLVPELVPHRHPPEASYQTVLTWDELASVGKRLKEAQQVAIDTETTGLDPIRSDLVGIAFSVEPNRAFYIPIGHQPPDTPKQLPIAQVAEVLQVALRDPQKLKIGQNLKFDLLVLRRMGCEVQGPLFDTLVASYLLNPDRRSHSLDALSFDLLGVKMIPIQELIGKDKTMAQVDISPATEYACEDVDTTLKIFQLLSHQLEPSVLRTLFEEVEMPFLQALVDIEFRGIPIDPEAAKRLLEEAAMRQQELAQEIFSMVGERFDLESLPQVRRVLETQVRDPYRTRTRRISVDRPSLRLLGRRHPLAKKLLEYQAFRKLLTKRLPMLERQTEPSTSRMHLSLHPAAKATAPLGLASFFCLYPEEGDVYDPMLKSLVRAPEGSILLEATYRRLRETLLYHFSGGTEPLVARILLFAKREGQVRTLLQRVRRLDQLNSPQPALRKAAEEEAIETILQGSANDLLKLSAIQIDRLLRERRSRAGIVTILPEGFLMEIAQEELNELAPLIRQAMEEPPRLRIPLSAQLLAGDSWNRLLPLRTG